MCIRDRGYTVPKTLDELMTLGRKMKADGLVPIAFGDKDGWPAMGTFDQINLRVNGYDFHVSLMAGKEDWAGDKVKKVFDTWRGLLEIHQADSLGRTWQEAVSYTHLRAHETVLDLVCRLLLAKKKTQPTYTTPL